MKNLLLLVAVLAGLTGCRMASENAQPGISGVRDVPSGDGATYGGTTYVDSSGHFRTH